MVLVTLSFTSAAGTVQGMGAESESWEGLREGGQEGEGRFRGRWVTTIKWQGVEVGWSHRAPGGKGVCVSPLTSMSYLLHWAGVSSQPWAACSSFPLLQGEDRAGSCPSSLPNQPLHPGRAVAGVVQAAETLPSSGFWISSAATYSIYFCLQLWRLSALKLSVSYLCRPNLFCKDNCNCNAFLGFTYGIIIQSKRLDSANISVKTDCGLEVEFMWKCGYDRSSSLFDFLFMSLARFLLHSWWCWVLDFRYFLFVSQASFSW